MAKGADNEKFERKLTNAIGRGVRTTNGVKTTVRVGSDWDKQGSPSVLRGSAIKAHDTKESTAPVPTRKRDVGKAVNTLHKKVAKSSSSTRKSPSVSKKGKK
jgi:hypothetical protein